MKLGNLIIGHDFREFYRNQPIRDSKLIFLELDSNSERHIRSLKLDLEILEQDLKDPNNFGRFSEIRENIARNKAEIASLESTKDVKAPLNTMLLNGLQNNIDDINTSLNKEQDLKIREQLEAKKLNCIKALTARQAPVKNVEELNEAVDNIEGDQRLLDALSSGKLDEVDLHLFLNSGLMPFIDSRFEGAINIAFQQMLVNDNVQSTLGKSPEQPALEADQNWLKYKKETEKAIEEMEVEKEHTKPGPKRKELESRIRHSKNQIKENRSNWTREERIRLEKSVASRGVLDSISPDTLKKLEQLLTEAQAIRTERVQDYLSDEFIKLEELMKNVKGKKIFGQETQETLEHELAEARSILIDQKQNNPSILRRLADNFQSAKISLSTSAEEVQEARKKRPQLEEQVTTDYARFQTALASFTPEKIDEITKHYRSHAAAKNIPEDSAIFKKALNALHQLGNPDSALFSKMQELSQKLAKISDMDPEEVLAISKDLNLLKPQLEFLENLDSNIAEALSPENNDAKIAHKTIKEIKSAKTAQEIEKTLDSNLGVEHLKNHKDKKTNRINGDPNKRVKFIPTNEFENEYRGHTKKGKMVFYEKGDEWYILIDENALKDSAELERIKKQVTHELLHVEFEKSDRVKSQVRAAMKEPKLKNWKKIKQAFIEMAKDTNKKPPHGDIWEDDAILGELYAMQNEMGRVWSKGNSPTIKLNNLLVGAGVAASIGDIAEKTRGYEKGIEPKISGYEEGVEAGEGNRNAGASVSDIATVTKENAVYESNKGAINALKERMEELQKSEFLGTIPGGNELVDAMSNYNQGTNGLNEDYRAEPESEIYTAAITSRIEKVTGDLNDLENEVAKAARKAPNNEISIFRKLWINTTFLSMEDFVQLGMNTYEFIQRNHKRRTEDHAARLGMAIFGKTDLGREASAKQQKAEMDEVNEWKSRYENMDAWQLMGELKGIANSFLPNQDQVKAILRILASKGRLDWRSEDLWNVLNKLQSSVVLKPGDQLLLHNPILLRQRLHAALGEIFDYDEFTSLERDNESAYQSGKGKYDTVHDRMQDQLNGRLDELLAQHRSGEQVEPMLYESILDYAIKNGKCFAENVMFHLIAGMAEGLLPPDRGLALGTFLNQWPAVDWFTSHRPPMSRADWKRLCLQKFSKSFIKGSITANGFGDDFQNWYWTEVQNCPRVIERVKKSVGERSWDHDWGRSIAPLGDSRTAKQFLSGRSGQQETKITGVGNAYVGAVQWLEENAKNPQYANKAAFAQMAGWIAMSEGMLDGTAFMESSKDINTRADASMNNSIPREASIGRHAGKTVLVHRQIVSAFVERIDPEFFRMIKGREAKTKEIKAELGIKARDYLIQRYPILAKDLQDVEEIDQIYSRIDLIIQTMFDQMSEAQFQHLLSRTAPLT